MENNKGKTTSPGSERDARGASISIEHLDISYHTAKGEYVEAVKDFNIEIKPEEFICIIGPSGCGKSTVMNSVAGFIQGTAGTVKIDGKVVKEPLPECGVVFQEHALFPWLNVLQNAEFGLKMQHVDKSKRREIALEKIRQVRLSGFETKYPYELSGGMKQRLGIARVLASNPRVLLMDEPFGALDSQTRQMMQTLLLDVWEQYHSTVVFITHDLDESIYLSDRIILMSARPGTIKDIVVNPLPRPRPFEITTSEEFMALKRRLSESLHEDMVKVMI